MIENLRELYRFRALIAALVGRSLASRYRGSALGFLWTLLNPLCLMAVYTLVFRYYIRFTVPHYAIFMFCGLLPWIWFTSAMAEGTAAIVSSGHLITKSMFPAHILPFVTTISTLINFLLSIPILLVFVWASGLPFHATLMLLPFLLLIQFVFLCGAVFALSALNVRYRDVQHLVANFLTFLFFLCPIIYPVSSVPARFRFTMDWNPVAVMTGAYHSLILDGELPAADQLIYLGACSLIVLVIGNMIFNGCRESFAELL